ncbi:GIY-YIG nuclease family protein [Anaerocolumna chitinilytica]|uniref:Nucleotide excision repair endonuclease n=1 Tax=Anaerocolumna chitinilytica TaxID=1727145 RepID=A0A7I8DKJ8_9FIRM|nr:GIY-YIG nuclease family protein [Anaerocolumna chitinilytica]BCJ98988.1 nucleotide excision repair endonuclease [Anaerocolumna chitinilytica]
MEHKYITNDNLKQIPKLPGIYKMLNSQGAIIYIGKSKCLQKRVQSYFVKTPKWEKVNRMVPLIRDIEYIITDTHLEARLLECSLIKEFKPRFNAQMKNDRNYFFIKVEDYNKYNPLTVIDDRTEHCFGPFRSKYTISEFLVHLKNIYPITKDGDQYRFEYHIFPITLERELFDLNKTVLFELLESEDNLQLMVNTLQSKLEEAVESYRFEMAAIYRDMIACFKMIKNGLSGYKNLSSQSILLKLPVDNDRYKLFYIKNGSILHKMITDKVTNEILKKFINSSEQLIPSVNSIQENEKEWIDYRDIIYSEISALPEEMIVLL